MMSLENILKVMIVVVCCDESVVVVLEGSVYVV